MEQERLVAFKGEKSSGSVFTWFFTIWSGFELHEMRLIPFVEIWWVYIGNILVPPGNSNTKLFIFCVQSASKGIFILPTNW